jgi:hypothetical protein
MIFDLPVFSTTLLSIAIFHGGVDVVCSPRMLWVYALALLPVDNDATTVIFGISSIVHFSRDVTLVGSVGLHLITSALALWDVAAASNFMLVYIVLVHIPSLCLRCWQDNVYGAYFLLVLLFTGAVASNALIKTPTFSLTHRMQRVVVIHVILNEVNF